MQRAESISRLSDSSEQWDILVIGGGATGLGIAVDAASRGYRTALVEQADFSEGTSSKSTKLIHGGVRYLRGGEVSLVRESLRERGRLLKNAPGLVKPLAFVVPAYRWYERFFYGTGLSLYDLLSGKWGIGSTSHLSAAELEKAVPNLSWEKLRGGTLYWDGQFDDARLAVAMAQTASRHGGVLANHVRAIGLTKSNGRISGARLLDQLSGKEIEVSAKVVINATGVFTDEIRQLDDETAPTIMAPSQGIHLVLDQRFLGGDTAVMIPNTDDGRVLFAIPWMDRLVLGTTDTGGVPVDLYPRAIGDEVDYLLDHMGRYLVEKPSRSDIKSTFAGLRPLVQAAGGSGQATSKISRDHALFVSDSGLVTMTGGKWTTYRQMAENAVDRAIEVGDLTASLCVTANLCLVEDTQANSSQEMRLDPALTLTEEEIERAVLNEMAMTVSDVLSRRSRSLFLDVAASRRVAPLVAKQMQDLLGESEAWLSEQLSEFEKTAADYSPPTSQSPSEVELEGS